MSNLTIMSRNLNESSSSEEDDEILKALKEATDSQFLKESLFIHKDTENGNDYKKKKNIKEASSPSFELPKTLRRTEDNLEISNDFGVTQDFKNFVAKELAKSLDKRLKEELREDLNPDNGVEQTTEKKKNKSTDEPSIGIKLMRDSKEHINIFEGVEEALSVSNHNKKHKSEYKTSDKLSELNYKCKEVAVDPDFILSKVDTSVWTERSKGVIYKYKKSNDGALIEID